MKTRQELNTEADFQRGCARMWDSIASLEITGPAALDATLRAVAHRECAKALERRVKLYDTIFWGSLCACLIWTLALVIGAA